MAQESYKGVKGVTKVVQERYKGVTRVLQRGGGGNIKCKQITTLCCEVSKTAMSSLSSSLPWKATARRSLFGLLWCYHVVTVVIQ
jgi:hypothetical protein